MLESLANLLPNNFSTIQWIALCIAATLAGISKTGVPGIGILTVPFIAAFFTAGSSTGLLLPLLAAADIFAVSYYRRQANFKHIIKLLPPALIGIATGSLIIRQIGDLQLKSIIGLIVLVMLILNLLLQKKQRQNTKFHQGFLFAAGMGFFAGLTTQIANAAGPVVVIYLLSAGLDKYEFIGTRAWFFLIINFLKIPIFISEGRITVESIRADLIMLPFIAIGAFVGILILKKIPAKYFRIIVQILAAAAAIKLLLL